MPHPARTLCLSALLVGCLTSAVDERAPLPRVEPPGAVQPVAPGARPGAALPRIQLDPPVPELNRLEWLGNGSIEVAHGLVLLPPGEVNAPRARALAWAVVRRAVAARPTHAEVDVSVYARPTYLGFGGPLPLLTASVPRARLADFGAYVAGRGGYDRAWVNPQDASTPPTEPEILRAVVNGEERLLRFFGSVAALAEQRTLQTRAQQEGRVRGGLFFHGSPRVNRAALTFDDAPHPLFLPLVLDVLRQTNTRATFFVIGRNAQAYPYFVRDMASAGHEVGNHTYHHVRLPGLSDAQVRDELRRTNDLIQNLTGRPARYFRPPGGDYSPDTLRVASELGLTTTFWTDDPGDFANPGDAVVETRLQRHLRPGGIVLLHDNAQEGLQVLPAFLGVAERRGLRLTTVGDLAARSSAQP